MNDSPSTHRPLVVTALIAGALGGGFVAAASTLVRPAPPSPPDEPVEAAVRNNAEAPATVGARLDAIERRLNALELAPPVTSNHPAGRMEEPTSIDESRLVELEAVVMKLAAAESRREESAAQQEQRREQREELRKERIVIARATILDPAAGERDKVEAWSALRGVAPWGDDIVSEMIRIGESAADEDLRADVWRQADGKDRNTLLVRPMLNALTNDSSERVRSEAAETLQNYTDEPGVVQALRHAAEHDPSEEVRQEARSSLNGG